MQSGRKKGMEGGRMKGRKLKELTKRKEESK
jgi:hypothetical protein